MNLFAYDLYIHAVIVEEVSTFFHFF